MNLLIRCGVISAEREIKFRNMPELKMKVFASYINFLMLSKKRN